MSNFRACIHTKTNGVQCGSPAMRGDLRCYFHYRQQKPFNKAAGLASIATAKNRTLAIDQVFRALIHGRIDPEVARAMLYAIQISSQP